VNAFEVNFKHGSRSGVGVMSRTQPQTFKQNWSVASINKLNQQVGWKVQPLLLEGFQTPERLSLNETSGASDASTNGFR
jgi:hypothetical protein